MLNSYIRWGFSILDNIVLNNFRLLFFGRKGLFVKNNNDIIRVVVIIIIVKLICVYFVFCFKYFIGMKFFNFYIYVMRIVILLIEEGRKVRESLVFV